jgi:hypothetical protein
MRDVSPKQIRTQGFWRLAFTQIRDRRGGQPIQLELASDAGRVSGLPCHRHAQH